MEELHMVKSRQFIIKKTPASIVLDTMLIMTLLVFSACGSDSSLVGRWELVAVAYGVDGEEVYSQEIRSGTVLEFISGGNGVVTFPSVLSELGLAALCPESEYESFTWSATSRGRLTLAFESERNDVRYSISGSTLTIARESGRSTEVSTYRRIN